MHHMVEKTTAKTKRKNHFSLVPLSFFIKIEGWKKRLQANNEAEFVAKQRDDRALNPKQTLIERMLIRKRQFDYSF